MRRLLLVLLATVALCLGSANAAQAKPLVIDHQGWHHDGVAANSLEAMVLAWRDGACVETDVRITSDHRYVIMHDADPYHATGQHGTVEDMTFEQVHAMSLSDGSHPPSLERVIAASDRHDNGCVFMEIKALGWRPADFAYIQDQVQEHGLGSRFKLYIARWTHLMMVQRPDSAPDLRVVWKMLVDLPDDDQLRHVSIDGLSCHFRDMTAANVTRLRSLGIEMYGKVTSQRPQWQHTVDVDGGGFLTNSAYATGWMARHG